MSISLHPPGAQVLLFNLLICLVCGSQFVSAGDRADASINSPAALAAKAKHDAAMRKAEAAYRDAEIAADQRYKEELSAAFHIAMKAEHLDEAKRIDALRNQVDVELAELQKGAINAGGQRVVNLLTLVDLKKDVRRGNWNFVAAGLAVDATPASCLRIPYHPPDEYDLHVEYVRLSDSWVDQILECNGHELNFGVQLDGTAGFESVNGKGLQDSVTTTHIGRQQLNKRYNSVVRVRKGSVSAYLDGKLVTEFKGDFSDVHIQESLSLGHVLGLSSHAGANIFNVVEVVEVSGKGKIERADGDSGK